MAKAVTDSPTYEADNLVVYQKSVDFLSDPRFQAAYRRGMDSGHHVFRARDSRSDLHIEWRFHVVLWAAAHAAHLPGDFVECGVNTGMYSLAVCEALDFNATGKSFWLFDTFSGIPEEQISTRERQLGRREHAVVYRPRKEALDAFAGRNGVEILTLPTGQGLLLRPPKDE